MSNSETDDRQTRIPCDFLACLVECIKKTPVILFIDHTFTFITMSNREDEDNNSDASSCYADMGFMFEGSEPTHIVRYNFPCRKSCCCGHESVYGEDRLEFHRGSREGTDAVMEKVFVEIAAVDGDPGAVQSGHYLWPAAPALARVLVESLSPNGASSCKCDDLSCQPCLPCRLSRALDGLPSDGPIAVAELGSGCGLVGLAAFQALSLRFEVGCMAFTDHDPGTLDKCRDNLDATLRRLLSSSEETMERAKKMSNTTVVFEPLGWGDEGGALKLRRAVFNRYFREVSDQTSDTGFSLILGSDLIYCREVVRPLLQTAASLMRQNTMCDSTTGEQNTQTSPSFIMSQSFSYDEPTEDEIDDVCVELGLRRVIVSDELDNDAGSKDVVKIQLFSFLGKEKD